jgi:hypothetical protein
LSTPDVATQLRSFSVELFRCSPRITRTDTVWCNTRRKARDSHFAEVSLIGLTVCSNSRVLILHKASFGACDRRSQRSTWPSDSSRPNYDPDNLSAPQAWTGSAAHHVVKRRCTSEDLSSSSLRLPAMLNEETSAAVARILSNFAKQFTPLSDGLFPSSSIANGLYPTREEDTEAILPIKCEKSQ